MTTAASKTPVHDDPETVALSKAAIALRLYWGLTQLELATRAGLPRATIALLETSRARGNSRRMWKGLANAYGVDLETLGAYFAGQLEAFDVARLSSRAPAPPPAQEASADPSAPNGPRQASSGQASSGQASSGQASSGQASSGQASSGQASSRVARGASKAASRVTAGGEPARKSGAQKATAPAPVKRTRGRPSGQHTPGAWSESDFLAHQAGCLDGSSQQGGGLQGGGFQGGGFQGGGLQGGGFQGGGFQGGGFQGGGFQGGGLQGGGLQGGAHQGRTLQSGALRVADTARTERRRLSYRSFDADDEWERFPNLAPAVKLVADHTGADIGAVEQFALALAVATTDSADRSVFAWAQLLERVIQRTRSGCRFNPRSLPALRAAVARASALVPPALVERAAVQVTKSVSDPRSLTAAAWLELIQEQLGTAQGAVATPTAAAATGTAAATGGAAASGVPRRSAVNPSGNPSSGGTDALRGRVARRPATATVKKRPKQKPRTGG